MWWSKQACFLSWVKGLRKRGWRQRVGQKARVVRPVRNQIQFLMQDLDGTLAEDHQARAIWDFLDRLDLSAFYASIPGG